MKSNRVYKAGDTVPADTFTHTPDYRPQTGELIAVRDHEASEWRIREFVGFTVKPTGLGKVSLEVLASCFPSHWAQCDGRYLKWEQHAPITQNKEPKLTFESVVKTLLEADVVKDVEYVARGVVYTLQRFSNETELQEALDVIETDRIRETALAKLTPEERQALGF